MKDGKLLERGRDLGVYAKGEDGVFLERSLDLPFIAFGRFNGFRMRLARPMTRFASGNVVRARNSQMCVDRLLKLGELRLMARATAFDAHIIAGRSQ